MHSHYDALGDSDGFVSYDEIQRALGKTTHEEWKKEIQPHDDGDELLNAAGLKNLPTVILTYFPVAIESMAGRCGLIAPSL